MRAMLTNAGRATDYMRAAGIDAVIAWSASNVRYLTGYWCWLEPIRSAWRGRTSIRQSATSKRCASMIETVEAYENLEALLDMPGVGGVFVGPNDLARQMPRPSGKE